MRVIGARQALLFASSGWQAAVSQCLVGVTGGGGADVSDRGCIAASIINSKLSDLCALKANAGHLNVEIRRVHVKQWAGAENCNIQGVGMFGVSCGNWLDGITSRTARKGEMINLDKTNSLVAGFYAYHSDRVVDERKNAILKEGQEAVIGIVSSVPGEERVILVSRVKAYPRQTVGFADIRDQLAGKYGPSFTSSTDTSISWEFAVVIQNERVIMRDDRGCIQQYGDFRACLSA